MHLANEPIWNKFNKVSYHLSERARRSLDEQYLKEVLSAAYDVQVITQEIVDFLLSEVEKENER